MKTPCGWPSSAALAACLFLMVQPAPRAGSLWKSGFSQSLVADKRAHQIGDIVTILVQENNTSSKQKSTKTGKSSSLDASISSFLYAPGASSLMTKGGQLPAFKLSGSHDFDGGGQINNSETITARIAVQVVDVFPNGQMLIEGRRQTAFSGEVQELILRGVVRAEDITSANTVFSYDVANASIEFVSKGAISDAQKKGWFTRIWDKLTPF